MRKHLLFYGFTLLVVALSLVSCSDTALMALAKQMPVVAAANQGMANTVITAQQAGALTADEARPLLVINLQIAQAGKQVDAAIGGLSALTPAQKMTVSAQIAPVAMAVTNEVNNLQIANPNIKTAILAALTTIQGGLTAITIALGN